MKIARWLVAVALLGLVGSVAKADSINDPVITMEGGSTSIVLNSLNDAAFTFTFTQPTTGDLITSVFVDFINNTGFQIGEVDTVYTATADLTFSCVVDVELNPYFNNCSPQTPTFLAQGDSLLVSYFGLDETHTGIPTAGGVICPEIEGSCFPNNPASDFGYSITTGDVPRGASFTFTGSLTPVPEPPAILLTLMGAAILLLFRRSKS